MGKILIIDDEKQTLALLSRILELEGYEICQATSCKTGLKQLCTYAPQVVLCDVCLPDGNGIELIVQMKNISPLTEIIFLTAHGKIEDGVSAMKRGAFDYLVKGDDNNRIIPLVAKAMEKASKAFLANSVVGRRSLSKRIIGKSPAILKAVSLAQKVAETDASVLLTGETGTGKEVFANLIHDNSRRNGQAFVAINCSSFSKDLLESEMFGHTAGAFTGAIAETKGLFEEANGGTLFLDEIGEMDISLQVRLLRVLETGQFMKIGSTVPIHVDVRVIAATNRDLEQEIVAGNFREDLFYRLSVFQIYLPPLRKRQEDISLFVKEFVSSFSKKIGKKTPQISERYMAVVKRCPWKGNVRELKNTVERSLVVAEGDILDCQSLPLQILELSENAGNNIGLDLATVEKSHIQKVLQYTNGYKPEAARLLGIGLTTLYRKMEIYGL
ncbi:sigma-54-dependent transcriptional regulator [Parabacteroides timonensis]|uniref:sigma-54-dependent transcriptional regulator n=1 Tax=Parabacteroides timonensis TaxID=1871013 RepID=UPI00094E6360|nr:sigma-54 dependent transcriptional regulator [Parabacteroides timonensis]